MNSTLGKKVLTCTLWGLASLALLWQLPISSTITENLYSRAIFPVVAFVIIHITDLFPISVIGTFLALATIFLLARVKLLLQKKFLFLPFLGRVVVSALAFYGAFLLLWGANYRRLSIEELLQLEPQKVTAADFENTAQSLLVVLISTQNAPRDYATAFASIRQAIQTRIKMVTGFVPTLPTQVKATPAGLLMIFGATGVVSPLTLEAHVDGALPEPFFLATAAHELVHTTGFAGEADTDLLAALAGLHATDAYARYSVTLWYFARVFGDLPEAKQQEFRAKLPETVKQDFAQYRQARDRHSMPLVRQVANFFYGGYLQSQGVEAGVADYSRTGRLLAAAFRAGLVNP